MRIDSFGAGVTERSFTIYCLLTIESHSESLKHIWRGWKNWCVVSCVWLLVWRWRRFETIEFILCYSIWVRKKKQQQLYGWVLMRKMIKCFTQAPLALLLLLPAPRRLHFSSIQYSIVLRRITMMRERKSEDLCDYFYVRSVLCMCTREIFGYWNINFIHAMFRKYFMLSISSEIIKYLVCGVWVEWEFRESRFKHVFRLLLNRFLGNARFRNFQISGQQDIVVITLKAWQECPTRCETDLRQLWQYLKSLFSTRLSKADFDTFEVISTTSLSSASILFHSLCVLCCLILFLITFVSN